MANETTTVGFSIIHVHGGNVTTDAYAKYTLHIRSLERGCPTFMLPFQEDAYIFSLLITALESVADHQED